jgi:aryl-alcohol dehydrogenase-like predicted oxidoreductase
MGNSIPRYWLRPDYSISSIIKGGWQLAGGHGPVSQDQAVEDMRKFVEAGITTFDCADIYTGVENLIGKFFAAHKSDISSGELPAVQVHTKFVPDLQILTRLNRSRAEAVIDRSLLRLGVERLDLVQFHWWDYSINRYVEVGHYLADLQKAGKIRYLGVTNFDARHLEEMINSGLQIVSNQVQYSVLDHRPEKNLVDLCRRHNINLLCYGVLAGGFLRNDFLGKRISGQPLQNRSLIKYQLIIKEFGGMEAWQDLLVRLQKVAENKGIGTGEVAIRYILQKPMVAGVIVGARNTRHLEKLKKINSFELGEQELQYLGIPAGSAPGPAGPVYGLERDREGRHGKIMKYNLNQMKEGLQDG